MYKNQIDNILINNRFNNCIKNIRTLKWANSDSDHLLIEFWMKVKFKKKANCRSTKRNIYNINKFSDKRIYEKCNCKIYNILKENHDNNEILYEA